MSELAQVVSMFDNMTANQRHECEDRLRAELKRELAVIDGQIFSLRERRATLTNDYRRRLRSLRGGAIIGVLIAATSTVVSGCPERTPAAVSIAMTSDF